ncbi:dephospho-CoA kinase [Sphaerisporangium album]|uniref:Dephospho-CoA kinase n=1 Tax=Sphaerisporangium album TaxID=509200 RepID=A0A367FMH3_9ACTN|nr:dephospho-CoA kinase [Sphaerisporangium album]
MRAERARARACRTQAEVGRAGARAGRVPDERACPAWVVALDGPSGAGKTTLGRALAAELDAGLVHMDALYPGWDGLLGGVNRLVEWVLRPLAAGEAARWRRYDWALEAYAEWRELPPSPVVVVEGVGAGALATRPYVSALIWVEAPLAIRKARALGRPEDGAAYAPHWDRWARQEEAYFTADRVRDRADVIVDTT